MHCGQPVAQAAPVMPRPTQPNVPSGSYQANTLGNAFDAQRKQKTTMAVVLGLLVAAFAIFFGIRAAGQLKLGAQQPLDPKLVAQGTLPSKMLEKEGNTGAPTLGKVAEKPVMPKDVEDWLKHLEKCEHQKEEISLKQEADLKIFQAKLGVLGAGVDEVDLMGKTDEDGQSPQKVTEGKFRDMKPEWEKLISFFNSYPPPEECKSLASDYNLGLNGIPDMTGDISDILNGLTDGKDVHDALDKVSKMKNQSYKIDRYFGQADLRLNDICQKYEKHKWFNIKTDISGGGLFGK